MTASKIIERKLVAQSFLLEKRKEINLGFEKVFSQFQERACQAFRGHSRVDQFYKIILKRRLYFLEIDSSAYDQRGFRQNHLRITEELEDDEMTTPKAIKTFTIKVDEEQNMRKRHTKKGVVTEFFEIEHASGTIKLGDFVEQVLLKLEGSIHITVLAGKKGSGKSSLLNQLLNLPAKQGFPQRTQVNDYSQGSSDLLFYSIPLQENQSCLHHFYLELQAIDLNNLSHLKLLLSAYLISDTFLWHTDDADSNPLKELKALERIRTDLDFSFSLQNLFKPRFYYLIKSVIPQEVGRKSISPKTYVQANTRKSEAINMKTLTFGLSQKLKDDDSARDSSPTQRTNKKTLSSGRQISHKMTSEFDEFVFNNHKQNSAHLSQTTASPLSQKPLVSPFEREKQVVFQKSQVFDQAKQQTPPNINNKNSKKFIQENNTTNTAEASFFLQNAEVVFYREDPQDIFQKSGDNSMSARYTRSKKKESSILFPLSSNRSPKANSSRLMSKIPSSTQINSMREQDDEIQTLEFLFQKNSFSKKNSKKIGGMVCNTRMLLQFAKKIIEKINRGHTIHIEKIEDEIISMECEQVVDICFNSFSEDSYKILAQITEVSLQQMFFFSLQMKEKTLSMFADFFLDFDFREESHWKRCYIRLKEKIEKYIEELFQLHLKTVEAIYEMKRRDLSQRFFELLNEGIVKVSQTPMRSQPLEQLEQQNNYILKQMESDDSLFFPTSYYLPSTDLPTQSFIQKEEIYCQDANLSDIDDGENPLDISNENNQSKQTLCQGKVVNFLTTKNQKFKQHQNLNLSNPYYSFSQSSTSGGQRITSHSLQKQPNYPLFNKKNLIKFTTKIPKKNIKMITQKDQDKLMRNQNSPNSILKGGNLKKEINRNDSLNLSDINIHHDFDANHDEVDDEDDDDNKSQFTNNHYNQQHNSISNTSPNQFNSLLNLLDFKSLPKSQIVSGFHINLGATIQLQNIQLSPKMQIPKRPSQLFEQIQENENNLTIQPMILQENKIEEEEYLKEEDYNIFCQKLTLMRKVFEKSCKQFTEQFFALTPCPNLEPSLEQFIIFIQNTYLNGISTFSQHYSYIIAKVVKQEHFFKFKDQKVLRDILFQRSQILNQQTQQIEGYMEGIKSEYLNTKKLLEFNKLEYSRQKQIIVDLMNLLMQMLVRQKYKLSQLLKEKEDEVKKLEEELIRLQNKKG